MEYFNLLVVINLCLFISFLVFSASYIFVRKWHFSEKVTVYECGFDPFHDSRSKFDVRFYLVAILFLVFDLEIILLFPWCASQVKFSFFSSFIALIFLLMLILAYVYEWKKGGMNWS